jgi:ADP-ribose pyrophosphatase
VTDFEVIAEQVQWQGRLLRAGSETYRYPNGDESTFDKVWHPGAVTVVPFDQTHVWLVRQPREASRLHGLLEIPAGKRDRPDEPLLELAQRELAEEVGKRASDWRKIFDFFPTPGFCDEHVTLFAATDLADVDGGAQPEDDEHIEVVAWPLTEIEAAIGETSDAKTLIGLLWLQRELRL